MENLKLVYDYKEIDDLRLSFNLLAKSVFGIDFENYYRSGFWNDSYICYSYIDKGRVVANVSASLLDIVLKGENLSAVQIGTVMTQPEYRGRGLAKSLMNHVLERYETERELIYLFANKTVLDFYPKFGFKPVRQKLFTVGVNNRKFKNSNLRKLDILNKDDLNLILHLASERKPVSRVFGVSNALHLLLFYCQYVFSDSLYYLNDMDAIIIFRIEEEDIHIYDIISKEDIRFEDIIHRIASEIVRKVVFHFTPDFEDLEAMAIPYDDHNDMFFVRSKSVNLPEYLMYPEIAHA